MKIDVDDLTFIKAFETELKLAHELDPDRYHWPVNELHLLVDRAKVEMVQGTYSKKCPVLLATYRKLALKHKKEHKGEFVM